MGTTMGNIHTVGSSRVPRSLERRFSLVEGCNGLPQFKDIPPGDTLNLNQIMVTTSKTNESERSTRCKVKF